MKTNLKVKYGDSTHEVEGKLLTVFCHDGSHDVKILDEDVQEINAWQTIEAANKLTEEHWKFLKSVPEFRKLFECVFKQEVINLETDTVPLRLHGSGVRHVVGMILLISEACAKGKRPHLVYPESHLHPRAQLGLVDMIRKFQGA
jgi:predicted ATPase